MGKYEKLLLKILRGTPDTNIPFDELKSLLVRLDFDERVQGSHHIFSKTGMEEIVNVQSKGGQAKPYQVKQIRNIIVKYQLNLSEDE